MGAFDFLSGKPRDDAPKVDEHAANPGADSAHAATAQGSVSAHTINQARENAERALDLSPRKRGRRARADVGNGSGNLGDLQAKIDAQIASQLDALHDPKAWEALLCFPADTALTLTGRKHWETSQRERDTVGATGSALARTLMITNPKGLAIMMFSAAMLNMYLPRMAQELRHLRAEKEKAKKDEAPTNT